MYIIFNLLNIIQHSIIDKTLKFIIQHYLFLYKNLFFNRFFTVYVMTSSGAMK